MVGTRFKDGWTPRADADGARFAFYRLAETVYRAGRSPTATLAPARDRCGGPLDAPPGVLGG